MSGRIVIEPKDFTDKFVCSECGQTVWRVPAREQPTTMICVHCQFLNGVEDPWERELIRQHLNELDQRV